MNRIVYSLICLLGLNISLIAQEDFRKTAPQGGPAPRIELGESTQFTLDNGLTVIVVENNRLPRVSFQLLVDVPPLVEGDKAGAASIAGQLLRSGTSQRSKAEIDEAIDYIGASLSASSGGVFGSSLSKHKEALLEIMSEVVRTPSFPEDEFAKTKQQVISSLLAGKEDPNEIAGRVANVLRYGDDHPYGETATEESIESLELADIRAYYEAYFKPNIAYLAIIGDITVAEARKVAEQYFGDWEQGTVEKSNFTNPTPPASNQVVLVNKPGAVQSVIHVTYPVYLKSGDPDRMAALLMNTILGSGSRGRLFRNLREDKGYTYGAYSQLAPDQEVGYFTANTSVRNEVTDSSIMEILQEMETLRTEVVDEDYLQEAKNRIIGAFARGTESPQTIANYALNIIRYGLDADYYQTYLERLAAVTPEDVRAAAQKYLRPDAAYIFVVGNQREIMDQLSGLGEVTLLDIYGQPATELPDAGDMTAEQVIDNYLDAIGGMETLQAVQDLTIEMETAIQGQQMIIKNIKKAPNKLLSQVSMMGNVMQEMAFDGEKGVVTAMGQKQPIEGEAAADAANEAMIFPELAYTAATQIELTGMEEIAGTPAYVLVITSASGKVKTEYFAQSTGLKLRTVVAVEAQGQNITSTVDYSDYQNVDGVLFPFTQKTTGGPMPFPIEMKVKSISLNTGVADELFKTE